MWHHFSAEEGPHVSVVMSASKSYATQAKVLVKSVLMHAFGKVTHFSKSFNYVANE